MRKTIFLDTNIFLHYRSFDQIDWLEMVKAESAIIIIPTITIRELNKHKDSHSRSKISERAGKCIKRLYTLMDPTKLPEIRGKVVVLFEAREPTLDFDAHQLNFKVQDDQLMANILMRRQEFPSDNIVLVTSDLGLTLVAKAKMFGIDTVRLPDYLHLPDEPDPNETRIKQLEQENRELKARTPDLSMVFENGEQYAEFSLVKPVILEKSALDYELAELRKKYPRRSAPKSTDGKDLSDNNPLSRSLMLAAGSVRGSIPEDEYDRYNNDVEGYISSYAGYFEKFNRIENLKRRTIQLEFRLVNEGTAPAEDIDIYLFFPDGFQLLNEYELPSTPKPPDPPRSPMTDMQRLAASIKVPVAMWSETSYLHDLATPGRPPRNVSSSSIKRINSYEVHVEVKKIKHNITESLDPLFLVFDAYENNSSFAIEYKILAANIPHEVQGKLNIIIRKEESQ